MDSPIDTLSKSLVDLMVETVGLPKTRFYHNLFWRLFHRPMKRLSEIGVQFDKMVDEQGLPAASSWCLSLFCEGIQTVGVENIPSAGPLLVAANHPGAYDGLIIFSKLNRKDTMWISSDIPFLKLLEHTSRHIQFSSKTDPSSGMIVIRNVIRHLREGGALVYFPSGHRDPDPAEYTGSTTAMDGWLDTFDTFVKYVPGIKILPVVASGVVSKYWANHPITRLRRKQIDQHRMAEYGQVITQLLNPGKLMFSPEISFGVPFTEQDLRKDVSEGKILQAVISRAKALLQQHCEQFNCNAE